MNHLCSSVFICGFLALVLPSFAAPVIVTDDLGRKVELRAPAQRIVTLAPFLTEIAFAVGAGNSVVGVSAYSDYPAEAAARPEVSSAAGWDMERIAALKPDLALVWRDSMRSADVERLERFGAAVFVADGRRLDDVPRLLHSIGRLTGHDGRPSAVSFESEIRELRAAYAGRRALRAFLEIWHRPLTTIAGPHFMNDALEICGARNAFADLPNVAPVVEWEEVYRRDPEVVVGVGSAGNEDEFLANWKARGTLEAVKRGRLLFLDDDSLQRASPRTPRGIRHLCRKLDGVR
jgi:iron complex transport system substrate-binding protein